ncbi:hypothetical protein LOD99_15518 [Oopsacas minuta]|uniref:START domain-containing protein n=1 Tax=Oopsacas minuta TaxID=111878 RepID=A0AAV7KDU9_9METZ|nr:hypothetical protein LOD99_15518 [Oopsacas minuta]
MLSNTLSRIDKDIVCPVKPNSIRGDVRAGYLISGDNSDSNICTVTFVLTIDLKGSIPTWAINRLMTSQPMILERAKRILETSVSNGIIVNPLKLVDEAELPPISEISEFDEPNSESKRIDTASPILTSDIQSDHEDIIRISEGDKLESFKSMSISLNLSVQDEIKEALFVKIDFNKIVLDYGVSNIGNWQFIGFEKEIVIMRKEFENNVYGFLGMGVIHSPPKKVFEILRNPQNRFVYDNMLKHLNVFHEFNNEMYLIEMQHEHNQCFLKQSRQTCLLVSEFSFANKYAIVSKSIEHDLCPLNENMKRLNVQKGGWIIEPRDKNGKTYSKIYYLIVIEIQDAPQFVINHVGKRQPLSIAFLRDFIHQTC